MNTHTITIGVLAGLIALASAIGMAWMTPKKSTPLEGALVIAEILPEGYTLSGEAVLDGTLHALEQSGAHLIAAAPARALTLRLSDPHQHYYDIDIARTLTLSGFSPQTRVSVSSDDKVFYDAVPMDWNGRIVLNTPPAAPFAISFSQNNHDHRLVVTQPIGGAL